MTTAVDVLRAIEPHWPRTVDQWEGISTILWLAIFKFIRASVMHHRAAYVDRFGWAILGFDYLFGFVFFVSTLFAFYPQLHTSVWIDRVLLGTLDLVVLWQLIEILVAEQPRVDVAIGGTEGIDATTGHTGGDRRSYYRRAEDRELRGIQ